MGKADTLVRHHVLDVSESSSSSRIWLLVVEDIMATRSRYQRSVSKAFT